jgi:hypothetical protein
LQRGHRFLKQFRQRLAQSISTERSHHVIQPIEPRESARRIRI